MSCVALLGATSLSQPPAPAAESGGAGEPASPNVRKVTCAATRAVSCPRDGTLPRGGRVTMRGTGLEGVRWVLFAGEAPRGDDVRATPSRATGRRLEARIPRSAKSGPLYLVTEPGSRHTASTRVAIIDPAPPTPLDAAPSSRFFFDGRRKPSFAFDLPAPGAVTVQVVREDRGTAVRRWDVQGVAGRNEIAWDGTTDAGPAPTAHYRFEVSSAGSAVRAAARTSEPQHFAFTDHLFPIRGRHNLGYTRTNNFGGGRSHKGQDMFARCGTPLAAARGGTVRFAGYHSAAGNYVVVKGRGSGLDYVYMHMRRPALVRTGQRIFTGQPLGEVGDSGNASGCHLHFELWTAPGWFKGGRPLNPLPLVRDWDRYS